MEKNVFEHLSDSKEIDTKKDNGLEMLNPPQDALNKLEELSAKLESNDMSSKPDEQQDQKSNSSHRKSPSFGCGCSSHCGSNFAISGSCECLSHCGVNYGKD